MVGKSSSFPSTIDGTKKKSPKTKNGEIKKKGNEIPSIELTTTLDTSRLSYDHTINDTKQKNSGVLVHEQTGTKTEQYHDEFPLSTNQLSELHDPKSLRSYCKLFKNKEDNLYKYLKTDKKRGIDFDNVSLGSSSDEVEETPDEQEFLKKVEKTPRFQKYGINTLPERPTKSFFSLVWEALQDKTMIVLSIAAVVSFALGLYETFGQPPEFDDEGNPIPKVDWVEGVAIMIAVVVVVLVGAANDYQKESQFAKLNRKKEDRSVTVIRNGDEHLVSIHELMVGDLITLQTGDVVPADSVLVDGSCDCDESALTGESDSMKKIPLGESLAKLQSENDSDADITTKKKFPDPMLISGSKLLSGLCKAVVTAVGTNSVHGRTMLSLQVEDEVTPLQARLSELADNISIYGSVAALILFLILFIRFLVYLAPGREFNDLTPAQRASKFMDIFITAITVIVVAVPEGLPLAVTLALAFATTRMTKDGNLVRVLRSCETMGSATAVCSDKTGTLTKNRMTVVKGFINGTVFDDSDYAENRDQLDSKVVFQKLPSDLVSDLLINISLNSTAFENKDFLHKSSNKLNDNPFKRKKKFSLFNKNNSDDELFKNMGEANQDPFIGSKTETALLSLATKSLDMSNLQKCRDDPKSQGLDVARIVQVIPFESSRKWSGIVVQKADGKFRFFAKGASEILLSRCDLTRVANDKLVPIDQDEYTLIISRIKDLAGEALRTIALVHRDYDDLKSWPPRDCQDQFENDKADPDMLLGAELKDRAAGSTSNNSTVLDTIVGLQDPLRDGVKESVEQCQSAGVTVRMVTGDNLITAKAIAKNCGILHPDEYENPTCAMEGPAFRKLTERERMEILPKLRVLARSSPNDKRVLVGTLKKMGDVVAVTGDGTNDAPALKLADVGFSMGISGTEVAREASDIILMTDDFSAIVNAIKWGRCVGSSIKKFIQFQLTVNITAVVLTFVSAVASKEEKSVLTAVQLLWVNLIMDTLAALALATDKPDKYILDRKPKGRNAPLIAVCMWKMILGQATLQLAVTFTLHFAGEQIFFGKGAKVTDHQKEQISALTFNTFVWLQFFKLIVTRKLDEGDGIKKVKDRITKENLDFFENLFRNYYFIVIISIIGGFQVLIMFVGGAAFSIAKQTGAMWATAIICGMLSLPVGVIIRIIPDEWAVKAYPSRIMDPLFYIIGFEFMRKGNKTKIRTDDHRAVEEEHSLLKNESTDNIIRTQVFERAKDDFRRNNLKNENTLNPVKMYQKWRRKSDASVNSHSEASEDLSSIIAPLTMVPTLVGGAVGGFSAIGQETSHT
ncbi:related to Calcium-transporting ATPase 2 [Saccharomycodes ludwigii]|uniref:Calcium-transporting ATPase n=1 Tax=Saccharomycodes ludwigii TaxID=36035 RepID=A0A376B9Y9_9ASCO|nr:related to Calcium-transporting ATPase 2 [Saccharomycodes ludwigii]